MHRENAMHDDLSPVPRTPAGSIRKYSPIRINTSDFDGLLKTSELPLISLSAYIETNAGQLLVVGNH
jgi:hypothetical protein